MSKAVGLKNTIYAFRSIGGDIVELNPDRDLNDMTTAVALKLLKEMVARISVDQ